MTEADELCRLAALMIDWTQGYDVPNPLEQLGGAIVAYRAARGVDAR